MAKNSFHERTTVIKGPERDLRPYFPTFITTLTMIGESDRIRGLKLLNTSYRVINRWRHGKIPVRWLRLTPDLLRALADDIEKMHDDDTFADVHSYIDARSSNW